MVDVWTAQDRQRALIACPIFEVFFGGARGGGKTDGVLGDLLEHAATYGKHAIGLMVRRQRTELLRDHRAQSRQIYGPLGWNYYRAEVDVDVAQRGAAAVRLPRA